MTIDDTPSIVSVPVPIRLPEAWEQATRELARPGDHWTGAQRLAVAGLARIAFAARHSPPWLRTGVADAVAGSPLGPETAGIVVTLAADARGIDREWADEAVAGLGAGPYAELVAMVASMAIIDAFAEAMDTAPPPLPEEAEPGEPAGTGPAELDYEVGDIGAYVPMQVPWSQANVARALTLTPAGNTLYRRLGMAFYHEGRFLDLSWDRPLSRPQTEVLATAVSAANECFY